MSAIQLFLPTFEIEECLNQIRECLEKGWTGIGFKTVEFEEKFAAYLGMPYGYFVNSNTSGMQLLLSLLSITHGWSDNDEVISSPLTFVSTNHSILHSKLIPKFADVDSSLCITVETIERQLTEKTKAVIFVSIGGNSGELTKVQDFCKSHGLTLILDAAHACGSRLDGRHLCHFADYSVYSFQAVKNLPTGDSGYVALRTEEEKKLARKLGWCGIDKDTFVRSQTSYSWEYNVESVGYKFHGNSIMAAIALAMLPNIDVYNSYRRSIVDLYKQQLSDVVRLRYVPHVNEESTSRHLIQFLAERRNELVDFLSSRSIGVGVHYISNSRYPMYRHMPCPVAEALDQQLLSLPLHMRLTAADVLIICSAIREFYGV